MLLDCVQLFIWLQRNKGCWSARTADGRTHSGSKRLKPAENKFIPSDLTSFSKEVSENSITSVSGHGLHYIFKPCLFVSDTTMARQFHNFFNLIFGVFIMFGLRVGRTVGRSVLRTNKGRKARQRLRRPWRLCDEEAKKKPYDFSSWQRGRIKQPRKVEHTVSPEGVKLQPAWNKHYRFIWYYNTIGCQEFVLMLNQIFWP